MENLGCTLFISIADTGSTSHVLNTGVNCIILNDVSQFKVSRPCNGNIKGIGGSNVSIWGTGTTYIPIKSDDRIADHIKVTDAVFAPLSTFNFLPQQLFIPALINSRQKTITQNMTTSNIFLIKNYQAKAKTNGKIS